MEFQNQSLFYLFSNPSYLFLSEIGPLSTHQSYKQEQSRTSIPVSDQICLRSLDATVIISTGLFKCYENQVINLKSLEIAKFDPPPPLIIMIFFSSHQVMHRDVIHQQRHSMKGALLYLKTEIVYSAQLPGCIWQKESDKKIGLTNLLKLQPSISPFFPYHLLEFIMNWLL